VPVDSNALAPAGRFTVREPLVGGAMVILEAPGALIIDCDPKDIVPVLIFKVAPDKMFSAVLALTATEAPGAVALNDTVPLAPGENT